VPHAAVTPAIAAVTTIAAIAIIAIIAVIKTLARRVRYSEFIASKL
jgi:hypothetical protein